MNKTTSRRRSTTLDERLTPCQCCGHVISQRHHILDFATHGEHNFIAYLCGNCHELYHICHNAYLMHHKKAWALWGAFVDSAGRDDARVLWLKSHLQEAQELYLQEAVDAMQYTVIGEDWDAEGE